MSYMTFSICLIFNKGSVLSTFSFSCFKQRSPTSMVFKWGLHGNKYMGLHGNAWSYTGVHGIIKKRKACKRVQKLFIFLCLNG